MTDTDAAAKWLDEQVASPSNGADVALPKHVVASLLAAYAAEVDAGKWVDVKDRLPSENDEYLIFMNGDVWLATFVSGSFYSRDHSEDSLDGFVTHWMPLPAEPAQEAK